MDRIDSTKRVLIAGGGLAGLTAAKRLVDLGFEVELLEGRRLLGGAILGGAMGQELNALEKFADLIGDAYRRVQPDCGRYDQACLRPTSRLGCND